jgi:serine protease
MGLPRGAAPAAAAVVLGVSLALAHAQGPDGPWRTLAQPVSPPAIDRGLVDDGWVPEPRQAPTRRRLARAGGVRGERPGRVIVKFRAEARGLAPSVDIAGIGGLARPAYADFDVIDVAGAAEADALAGQLALRADVEYAQAAHVVHAHYRPNDPLYGQQWNLQALEMERAWDINRGSTASVIVAVLDSGLAFRNGIFEFTADAFDDRGFSYPALGRIAVPFAAAPDLAGPDRFVAPRDFIWNDDLPLDMDGHGTHVAGTIGQVTDNAIGVAGMAFNVRLMPVKVIAGEWDDIFGSPQVGTDDVVARGIRYAVDNGARIINMSIGRDGPPAPAIGAAMRDAVARGAFIAVSGGNDFENGNPIERIAEQAGPIDGAMVVAGVGRDLRRAYYSGVQSYIEITAPGGNSRAGGSAAAIFQQTYDAGLADTFLLPPSAYQAPRFDVFAVRGLQGTSMATAHVTGLAALLYSQGITSPAAIEAAIKQFALDQGAPGPDEEYGHGLIDPRATLRGLGLLK